jgi:hypothetical protein
MPKYLISSEIQANAGIFALQKRLAEPRGPAPPPCIPRRGPERQPYLPLGQEKS